MSYNPPVRVELDRQSWEHVITALNEARGSFTAKRLITEAVEAARLISVVNRQLADRRGADWINWAANAVAGSTQASQYERDAAVQAIAQAVQDLQRRFDP